MFGLVLAGALLIGSDEVPALQLQYAVVRAEHVMQIPDVLRQEFAQRVTSVARSDERRLQLLVRYLFAPDGLGITYQHDATYTVAQAWQFRKANCLTFTLLTVALAREAGIDAYGQEIDETLFWRQDSQTIYRTTHVNAGVRVQQRRFTVDVASNQVLSRTPPARIADARLLAQYYNNRAAELMAEGALAAAQAHASVSLKLDPLYAASWNNAGVVQLRVGQPATAEQHYQRALDLDHSNASALTNLALYYARVGSPERARPFERRLRMIQRSNPFHQFLLATEFERQGAFAKAVKFYRRAIRLHPSEHRFHFGLARAYFGMAKPLAAGHELQRARELSEGSTRSLYQAKLDRLGQAGS